MRLKTALCIGTICLVLTSCDNAQVAEDAQDSASPVGLTELPVSINATMVGLIDSSADYLWAVGNGDLPQDEADWDLVRSAAYDMILGGQIIKVPGTGEMDTIWTDDAGWREMADNLTGIGQDALPLAESQSTDIEAWRAIGDRLVENCEGCHQAFKPEIPSEGILHRSTERESRGVSVFD